MGSSTSVNHDLYELIHPGQVSMRGYLGNRMQLNEELRLKNFVTEEWLLEGFRKRPGPHPWSGEHIGKWLHAATLALENNPDSELQDKMHQVANGLMDCQDDDGYLGTYSEDDKWGSTDMPFTDWEIWPVWDVWVHKYVLIGLLSYYQTSADNRALECSKKIADLLIKEFGKNKRDILKSGAHDGMAASSILEPVSVLYQLTDEQRYLDFCHYVIQAADSGFGLLDKLEASGSVQSVGNKKAYEMMSNYVGLMEHWRATGDKRALAAVKTAWESIVRETLFITGAPDAHELFSEPGTLVPTGPCTETCVQVTWIQMSWQLLRATGNPRYAAMLHHHYYNHMLAAQHPDGIKWSYFTSMADKKHHGEKKHCCSSSGPRAIAMIPQVAYMTSTDSLAINLYEASVFTGEINGTEVRVEQQTNYPWQGEVSISVEVSQPVKFNLNLLVPDFVQAGSIEIDDYTLQVPGSGTYAQVSREWSGKTRIKLSLDMPVVVHKRDYEGEERYALSRGPFFLAHETEESNKIASGEISPDIKSLNRVSFPEFASAKNALVVSGTDDQGEIELTYRPFSEAGPNGEIVNIWLPAPPVP